MEINNFLKEIKRTKYEKDIIYFFEYIFSFFFFLFVSINSTKVKNNNIYLFFPLGKLEKFNEINIQILATIMTIIIPLLILPIENLGSKSPIIKELFVSKARFFSFLWFLLHTIILYLLLSFFEISIILSEDLYNNIFNFIESSILIPIYIFPVYFIIFILKNKNDIMNKTMNLLHNFF